MTLSLLLMGAVALSGCRKEKETAGREAAEAPPSTPTVVPMGQVSQVHVDQPAQFPLVAVAARSAFSTLNVTGQIQPDPSRELPVLSIANGRVTALHVGLGDMVHKGQLVMEVQSPDVTTAFDSYLKAVADEQLANTTLTRDKLLYDKGAIAQSQLQVAQNGETDAQADLRAAEQQLRILGVDKNNPGDTVKVYAPISGVIVAQNTTAAGAAGLTVTGAAGSLTVADLSHIWVVCDVYENDMAQVHLGEQADIRLDAFPDKVRSGTIANIGAILDPSLRTAKVRIQVANPDHLLRIGMFATASFHNAKPQAALVVPANAILHLHDHDYVFVPTGAPGGFRRVVVQSGRTLPGDAVEITQGLREGQQVVSNALELEDATEQ
ncbi:MAG: efflux RND transporter periplasmic adaptor subunit [Janthinobacterium lividum]